MSDAKYAAKKAIEVIKKSPTGLGQSGALSSLISGVQEFVNITHAEAELAKELPKLQRELEEKQRFLNEPDIETDEERDLQLQVADLSGTIQEADTARRGVNSNRETLRAIQREVDKLNSALHKALG